MESEKLLPCPFCGGEGVMGETEWGSYFAGCRTPDCPAEGGAFDFVDAKSAAAHWNTRAPADLRSALEAETIERACAAWRLLDHELGHCLLHSDATPYPEHIEMRAAIDALAALAPIKGDVS